MIFPFFLTYKSVRFHTHWSSVVGQVARREGSAVALPSPTQVSENLQPSQKISFHGTFEELLFPLKILSLSMGRKNAFISRSRRVPSST